MKQLYFAAALTLSLGGCNDKALLTAQQAIWSGIVCYRDAQGAVTPVTNTADSNQVKALNAAIKATSVLMVDDDCKQALDSSKDLLKIVQDALKPET